jgi:alpha-galactosidase
VRPAAYPREPLRDAIAEGKRLRKYLLGVFYPLTKPTASTEAWCAYQYDLPATGEGAAFVFRRPESPYYGYQLNLRGIDPAADYEVTEAPTYTPDKPRRIKGAELQRYRASIDELPGSLLIEYRRIKP